MAMSGGNELVNAHFILEKSGVHPGMIFADLGCGAIGHFVFPASGRVGSAGKVYALDIQKPVLQAIETRARLEGAQNIMTVWSDLEKVGAAQKQIQDGSVDVVLLANTLFQIKDRASVLKEAARMLKSGGTLAAVEWSAASPPGLGPSRELRVDSAKLEETAAAAGFALKEKFDAGPYHYGMVFGKGVMGQAAR